MSEQFQWLFAFKKQAKALARQVDRSDAENSFVRASGECVCDVCGLKYFDHPQLDEIYLTLLCDGTWVHL